MNNFIAYIKKVKAAVSHIPVGYVDAYYMFVNYPEIADACDVIFANCYPFWEHCALDISVEYMKKMYELAVKHSKGKPVVISETGWPTRSNNRQIHPNVANKYNQKVFNSVIDQWSEKNGVTCFFFEAFDEV